MCSFKCMYVAKKPMEHTTITYSTDQRHCQLTRRPEPARALIVNI